MIGTGSGEVACAYLLGPDAGKIEHAFARQQEERAPFYAEETV